MKKNIRKMVYAAMFVSLSFVFSLFSIRLSSSFQIGFTEFPLMASGFILGPLYGSLVGLVKDILTMMRIGYPPSLFTLAPIVLGLIPGIYLVVLKAKKLYHNIFYIGLAVFSATIARTIVNCFALYYVTGLTWEAIILGLPPKIVLIVVEGIIYILAFKLLLPHVHRMFKDNLM